MTFFAPSKALFCAPSKAPSVPSAALSRPRLLGTGIATDTSRGDS
jgi:hypothetical protein